LDGVAAVSGNGSWLLGEEVSMEFRNKKLVFTATAIDKHFSNFQHLKNSKGL